MNRALISRVAGVLAIAATALVGAGAAQAQVSPHPGSQIQGAPAQIQKGGAQAVKAAGCWDSYPYSSGDWVRIRATPGGEPVLGYSMRWDRYSWPNWDTDYSGNWVRVKNLRTGVTGWVSLDWVDWYQPTCV